MCTTVIVGRLASTTGRVILGHNEDSGGRCMHQQFWVPGGSHSAGEFVEGEPGRARVPQAPVTLGTYWSNMLAPAPGSSFDQGMANDAGVVMCSNSGGDSYDGHLSDEEVGLFEGGIGFLLRRCVMERAHTAREAVEIAGELISKYGYWSPARNYSFADAQEAWVLNVVKGKHFVAHRVPDDKVVLISNYLAVRVVDFSDTENVIASPDLIDYAVKKGRFSPAAGSYYHEFDFSVAYQPDEIRLDPNKSIRMRTGWQYITGEVFDDPNHYPEMVEPAHKMSVEDVKAVLRLTAEETYRTRGDGRPTPSTRVRKTSLAPIRANPGWQISPMIRFIRCSGAARRLRIRTPMCLGSRWPAKFRRATNGRPSRTPAASISACPLTCSTSMKITAGSFTVRSAKS